MCSLPPSRQPNGLRIHRPVADMMPRRQVSLPHIISTRAEINGNSDASSYNLNKRTRTTVHSVNTS